MVFSLWPDASTWPSGLKARPYVLFNGTFRVASFLVVPASHRLMLLSSEPLETTVLPSGLYATSQSTSGTNIWNGSGWARGVAGGTMPGRLLRATARVNSLSIG